MKNKLPILLLVLTLSGFMATAARAGGGGPPPGPPHHHHYGGFGGPVFFPSISFVVADPEPSHSVSLVGHVYRQIGDDTYLFTDGTSTFQLDSNDSNLPIGPRIVIGGRFSGDAEIDVRHWHYVE